MEYQGRSPLKDVVRSVVISAGMIAPATMLSCAKDKPNEPPPSNGNESSGGTQATTDDAGTSMSSSSDAGTDASDAADVTDVQQAPPRTVVRPRSNDPDREMPTRGFAGGRRPSNSAAK